MRKSYLNRSSRKGSTLTSSPRRSNPSCFRPDLSPCTASPEGESGGSVVRTWTRHSQPSARPDPLTWVRFIAAKVVHWLLLVVGVVVLLIRVNARFTGGLGP
jgi:hypothetical protein